MATYDEEVEEQCRAGYGDDDKPRGGENLAAMNIEDWSTRHENRELTAHRKFSTSPI